VSVPSRCYHYTKVQKPSLQAPRFLGRV
jgi:hypothetical protein